MIKKLYFFYTFFTFFLLFFCLFPVFFLLVKLKRRRLGLVLTKHWSALFYFLIGIRIIIENKHFLNKKENYIYCPNHFSFLDITIMTQMPISPIFVGKESLSDVFGFGYYFRKFHIMVNRDSLRSRFRAFQESVAALKDGFSLTVFPEGGINVESGFQVSEFKEGPFRMALETGSKLVPVTIADNWRILPDDGKFLMHWKRKARIIIHEPIDPSEMEGRPLEELQEEVRSIIQQELNRRNSDVG